MLLFGVVSTFRRGLRVRRSATDINKLSAQAGFCSFPRYTDGPFVDPFTREKFPPELENAHRGKKKAAQNDPPEDILSTAETAAFWSNKDEGKFFKLSSNVENCPEILPASIRKDFELTGLSHQMIRSTTLELVSTLNKFSRLDSLREPLPQCHIKPTPDGLWPALRLEGRYGLGKSTQLVSIIEHAEQRDALILYIPRASLVTEGFGRGFCVYNDDTNMYETPAAAREILSNFLVRNAEVLGVDLRTVDNVKPSSAFSTAEFSSEGKRVVRNGARQSQSVKNLFESIAGLIREGITNEMKETQALVDLLKLLRTQDDYPVVVAVDSCDALTSKEHSVFLRKGRNGWPQPIPVTQLMVANSLLDILGNGMKRGLALFAWRNKTPSSRSFVPLGTSVLWDIKPFTFQEVKKYSAMFWETGMVWDLDSPRSRDQVARRNHMLSSGNARELRLLIGVPFIDPFLQVNFDFMHEMQIPPN